MVEYNTVNAKLSDSQLKKLKSAVKNQTEQFYEWMSKCLVQTIYLMNCY